MRIFIYPLVAFFVNYLLFNGFPSGGGGTGLGVLITVPVIVLITAAITGVHYFLNKRNKSIKYFQFFGIVVLIVVSYYLFITQPGNTPLDIVKRMRQTARGYDKITINDYFLEEQYYNYEKIVAAKKKFNHQIPDTVYVVRVSNAYDNEKITDIYGIMYFKGFPSPTSKSVQVEKLTTDTFRFREIIGRDTIVYYGNEKFISKAINISDSFVRTGNAYPANTTINRAATDVRVKSESPDKNYWAYSLYYWLL